MCLLAIDLAQRSRFESFPWLSALKRRFVHEHHADCYKDVRCTRRCTDSLSPRTCPSGLHDCKTFHQDILRKSTAMILVPCLARSWYERLVSMANSVLRVVTCQGSITANRIVPRERRAKTPSRFLAHRSHCQAVAL